MSKFRANIFLIQTTLNFFELLLVLSSLQNFDFLSQFSMSKIIQIFLFFSLKNIILGANLSLLAFFKKKLQFLKHFLTKNEPNICQIRSRSKQIYQKNIGAEFTHLYISQKFIVISTTLDTLAHKSLWIKVVNLGRDTFGNPIF